MLISYEIVRGKQKKYDPSKGRGTEGLCSFNSLTKADLIDLYFDQGLTLGQIGTMYGISLFPLKKRLQEWGLSKTPNWKRRGLALDLPERLVQIIYGTLLGDSCIGYVGDKKTARLQVSHTHKQYTYLRQLHSLFGPWACPIFRTSGLSIDKTGFLSYGFTTVSHPEFKRLRSLFYKDELKGQYPNTWLKAPPPEIFRNLQDISLAYWYFDDGSFDGHSMNIVTYFPLVDIQIILKDLCEGTKLQWRVKQCGNFLYQLSVVAEDRDEFFRRIVSFATPDMGYKFPVAWQSYISGALMIPPHVNNLSVESLSHYPVSEWRKRSTQDQELWVQEVFNIYRSIGFPLPQILPDKEAKKTLDCLQQYKETLESGHSFVRSNLGLSFCNGYMPHRYQTEVGGRSAWQTFQDDVLFKKVIRAQFQAKSSSWVTPSHMRGALSVYGGNRTPSNFRATVAKVITDALCPEGGTVWDPCAGFGGRLLGVLCSERQAKYIGTEPSPETIGGLSQLWNRIASLTGWETSRVQLLLGVAEKDCPPKDSVDLVLTSPPYFRKEKYKGGIQSHLISSYAEWKQIFLLGMLTNAFEALHDGGHLVINIQDITLDKEIFSLVSDCDALAREVGFSRKERWWYPLSYMGKQRPDEPLLVYQKGSCGQEPFWDFSVKHQTLSNTSSTKTNRILLDHSICARCGTPLTGIRGRVYCLTCKHVKDAATAREKRAWFRVGHPAKALRTFVCRACGQSWDTEALGSFRLCPVCKETHLMETRKKLCAYRHCGRVFTDTSVKSSMFFCCEEHRRREKLFRCGKALNLDYFKNPDPVLVS